MSAPSAPDRATLLVVSPVRNEAAHIECVVAGMAAQTRPPDLWMVLDDGSTDGTLDRLHELARAVPFMRVASAPASPELSEGRDRLAAAAAPRAFNLGLEAAGENGWSFIAKLDGDVELPPDYYEQLLRRFEQDPSLGIACGDLVEDHGGGWRRIPIPEHHVHGALKLYRRECFDRIGGVRRTLGWDTIDETYARALGYRTRSHRQIVARHHRPWGSADGTLRGRARHGVCAWICGYGPGWVVLRSLKLAAARPRVLSGGAFLFGYLRAAATRTSRVEDPLFRRQVRRELRGRMRAAATGLPRRLSSLRAPVLEPR